jgi:hypothetical protein
LETLETRNTWETRNSCSRGYFSAMELAAGQWVVEARNMQQFQKRGICCATNGQMSFISRKRWGLPKHQNLFIWTRTHGQDARDAHATGTRSYGGLSTLTGWSKNVRKRKISKVDRGFQGVARGCGLRTFFSEGPFVGSRKAARGDLSVSVTFA